MYTNPVYPGDFPDPSVIRVDDTYYAYSTNVGQFNIPTLRSDNLTDWQLIADALPELPPWAAEPSGMTWAPGVIGLGGRYILYYATHHAQWEMQCIGRATGEQPEGPFVDDAGEPFLCTTSCPEPSSSIDPYPFVAADGTPYLYWTSGEDQCNNISGNWVQPLNEDGSALLGEPVQLVVEDQFWEAGGVENPAAWQHEGQTYTFYSANWWEGPDYAVGYAVCETPMGPCTKPADAPILQSGWEGTLRGPGGETIFTDAGGNLWLAYHAWTAPNVGYPSGNRSLHIDLLHFVNGVPVVGNP